ncbi:NAD(P)H-binding protein [Solihabitans fulvus]|uniref:NAD(P)H-binding protein n=1 Tax=Solihabitans fulvus TaxID=1892852 RepID=A0A5B2XKP6_9PSEU|nr:saccharopine dehydrogenase NADP-binding domain-containing protein [Solihabitans fulvus]KAA2264337.1 NAD(P)H-binding protein [Solihabitans fulvus]
MAWMVYGANGYTGRLIAELAVRRGETPILAGRSRDAVAELAGRLGLEHRVFALDAPQDARNALAGVEVVAHCAGPFSATSGPMVAACLATGTHYLDITGEIDVFEDIFRQHDAAERAGVVLLPGAGFDVVPTDCLAATLAAQLPTATSLDLAFVAEGGMSPGTAKTTVESGFAGGRVREDGELRAVPLGHRKAIAVFRSGPRRVSAVPWGDLSTAYRSTGIPNITTYTTLPGPVGTAQSVLAPLLRAPITQRIGKELADRLVSGPSEARRAASHCQVWGEARDEDGGRVSASLSGPNAYSLTADAVLRAVARLTEGGVVPGAHTPSSALGADFVTTLDGVEGP